MRNQPRLLEELRTTLAGEGATRVMPRPLSRIPSRPWVLLLLVLAGYVTYHGLIGITGLRAPMDAVADARIRWLLVASVLVAVSYAAGALALMGASVRDLAFGRTFLRQVAASYASRQHLAGRGGDAVLGAHLREHGAGPHEATETVALTRLIGALVHLIALVLALVSVAAQGGEPLRTPSWSVPVILTVTTVAALGAVLLWRRRAEIVLPLAAAVAGLPRLARRATASDRLAHRQLRGHHMLGAGVPGRGPRDERAALPRRPGRDLPSPDAPAPPRSASGRPGHRRAGSGAGAGHPRDGADRGLPHRADLPNPQLLAPRPPRCPTPPQGDVRPWDERSPDPKLKVAHHRR
ncbi:lysylphosphatidylglycerol synthase domain-containing protein [Actinomadura madurae]|uniref:lysylphosphatidylglycerol synthase domain-containing protein n=1 Tax=Actinomadura madurae TaxID=1993 RepID=UPI003FD8FD85